MSLENIKKIAKSLKADTAITKSTVNSILKTIDSDGLDINVDSDTIEVWFDSDTYDKGKKVVKQINNALKKKNPKVKITSVTPGNKTIIHYKGDYESAGEWNDPSSKHHY